MNNNGFGGAVLMDLSKAFDTLHHDLLIAKLHAYGFDNSALKLIKSYLSNRWQRTKINTSFSSWEELILDSGVDKYRSNDEYLRYGTLIKGLEEAIYDDVFELFTIQGYEECALKELRKIENVLKKAKKKYIT